MNIYRYALSQQKNAPPPAPVRMEEDFPELSESEVVPEITADSTDESSKLSDNTSEEKPAELAPTVPTPATKADSDIGTNNDTNLGSQDLTKP